MKKTLLFIIAVFAVSKLAAQGIPDGEFEAWNTPNWINPAYYGTSNNGAANYQGFTPNVVEVTGWEAGVNGVQMTTELVNGTTIVPGYFTNSIGNPIKGKGGIPYNQAPAKIEIWYNSNEMAGDSGAFFVFFKNGADTASYKFAFPPSDNINSYPALTETLTPALSFTPDSVIFAATSSISAIRNGSGVPGSTFTISGVEFEDGSNNIINPTYLNGNFTMWYSDTAFSPVGWTAIFPESFRTMDSYAGKYALELQTQLDPYNNYTPTQGGATTGYFNNSFYGVAGGQPYTKQVDTLDIYYKYSRGANSSDSGFVQETFKKNGSIIENYGYTLGPQTGYVHMFYVDSNVENPDSAIVTFYSSALLNPQITFSSIGNVLEVDNISFRSQPLSGIKPVLMNNNKILIYPNPASTQLTVASAQSVVSEVRLLNIMGQTILDKTYADGVALNHENIDISTLPAGMYFISVTSGGETTTGKISIINK